MFTSFLKVVVLAVACVSAVRAVEECRFNEYSDTKLISDFSAVIIEVKSLQGCLNYLKKNKLTHKAAAYDSNTGKCCSVLQDLDYSLEAGSGWTAFEVREEIAAPESDNNIKGLCPGRAVVLFNQESTTLSVYSYNVTVCNLDDLIGYQSGPDCIGSVTTLSTGDNLEFSVSYSTESSYDILRIASAYQDLRYSGNGLVSGVLHGPTIFLSWVTDTSVAGRGFCLTVRSVNKPVANATFSTLPPTSTTTRLTSTTTTPSRAPPRTTRQPDGTEASRGVCQWNATYIPANSNATLSIYSELFDPCDNLAALSYENEQVCDHSVYTDAGYTLSYYLIYNTEEDYDYLRISYGNQNRNFTGQGSFEDDLNQQTARITWISDIGSVRDGFCLKIRSLPAGVSLAPEEEEVDA